MKTSKDKLFLELRDILYDTKHRPSAAIEENVTKAFNAVIKYANLKDEQEKVITAAGTDYKHSNFRLEDKPISKMTLKEHYFIEIAKAYVGLLGTQYQLQANEIPRLAMTATEELIKKLEE